MAKKKRSAPRRSMNGKLGHWAFIIGVLLAILTGLVPALQLTAVTWLLVLLGLVVGVLNITARETTEFLVATIALLLVGNVGNVIPYLGGFIIAILNNIVAFVAPAALIVALKAIYVLAAE